MAASLLCGWSQPPGLTILWPGNRAQNPHCAQARSLAPGLCPPGLPPAAGGGGLALTCGQQCSLICAEHQGTDLVKPSCLFAAFLISTTRH